MKQIQVRYEQKNGSKWIETGHSTDEQFVKDRFLEDMIAKYQWGASFIGSIKRHQNYDGTCDYTVSYRNDGTITNRNIYTIREH